MACDYMYYVQQIAQAIITLHDSCCNPVRQPLTNFLPSNMDTLCGDGVNLIRYYYDSVQRMKAAVGCPIVEHGIADPGTPPDCIGEDYLRQFAAYVYSLICPPECEIQLGTYYSYRWQGTSPAAVDVSGQISDPVWFDDERKFQRGNYTVSYAGVAITRYFTTKIYNRWGNLQQTTYCHHLKYPSIPFSQNLHVGVAIVREECGVVKFVDWAHADSQYTSPYSMMIAYYSTPRQVRIDIDGKLGIVLWYKFQGVSYEPLTIVFEQPDSTLAPIYQLSPCPNPCVLYAPTDASYHHPDIGKGTTGRFSWTAPSGYCADEYRIHAHKLDSQEICDETCPTFEPASWQFNWTAPCGATELEVSALQSGIYCARIDAVKTNPPPPLITEIEKGTPWCFEICSAATPILSPIITTVSPSCGSSTDIATCRITIGTQNTTRLQLYRTFSSSGQALELLIDREVDPAGETITIGISIPVGQTVFNAFAYNGCGETVESGSISTFFGLCYKPPLIPPTDPIPPPTTGRTHCFRPGWTVLPGGTISLSAYQWSGGTYLYWRLNDLLTGGVLLSGSVGYKDPYIHMLIGLPATYTVSSNPVSGGYYRLQLCLYGG